MIASDNERLSAIDNCGAPEDEISDGHSNTLQFPWKLHVMLSEMEGSEYESIVSWLPDGNAFKVHEKEKFASDVMPRYFASAKFRSFQRSLSLWGFQTETKKPGRRGSSSHSCFVRDRPELCRMMQRIRVKNKNVSFPPGIKSSSCSRIQHSVKSSPTSSSQSSTRIHQQELLNDARRGLLCLANACAVKSSGNKHLRRSSLLTCLLAGPYAANIASNEERRMEDVASPVQRNLHERLLHMPPLRNHQYGVGGVLPSIVVTCLLKSRLDHRIPCQTRTNMMLQDVRAVQLRQAAVATQTTLQHQGTLDELRVSIAAHSRQMDSQMYLYRF